MARTTITPTITHIEMQYMTVRCCICGAESPSHWGVPISMETGLIVANDFKGEWGGKPACETCWRKHEDGAFVGDDPQF